MKYDNNKSLTENAMAGVDITEPTTSIVYKVVSEWAAPTYYDYDTNVTLYDECQASPQCLWVVSYDTEGQEIIEWLERFETYEHNEALAMAENLNKEK